MKPVTLKRLHAMQTSSLGFALIRCGQLLNDRGMAKVNAEAGRPVMREAHSRLIPHLQDPEGIRVTELARKIGVTKQAAQQLVADMVALNVVRLELDPDDARARRVILTPEGITAIAQGTEKLHELDREVAAALGKADAKVLHGLLTRLLGILEPAK